MKKLVEKIQVLLFLPGFMLDAMLNTQERVKALEAYVKDLKWVAERMGYDPKKHGYPPSQE